MSPELIARFQRLIQNRFTLPQGVALGYYISRPWRFSQNDLNYPTP